MTKRLVCRLRLSSPVTARRDGRLTTRPRDWSMTMPPGKYQRRIIARVGNPTRTTDTGDLLIDDQGGVWEMGPHSRDQTSPRLNGYVNGQYIEVVP